MNNTLEQTKTPAPATATVEVKQTVFKVGYDYKTFLIKNNWAPSPEHELEWRTLSKEASKKQLGDMVELNSKGCKTKITKKAVYNARDQRFDTALTARVVRPGCDDSDLIVASLESAQKRASKRITDMTFAARAAGAL